MRRMGELRAKLDTWNGLEKSTGDLLDLLEMSAGDPELLGEIEQERDAVLAKVENLELESALSGPHDRSNAILIVHSGEGGIDAQDWASMLARMYLRWADKRGFKAEMLDSTDGEEAGIKNATLEIKGANAYGLMRGEGGSHRLVRLSPFDSAHRRHTAFALVEVLPEIETDNEIDLRTEDVRVDTYRASGAGGQHVNKTESAIRLTHLPTGIVVFMQEERSQHRNRQKAMAVLRSRIFDLQRQKLDNERAADRKSQVGSGDRSERIRTYNFPQGRLTDHRINLTLYKLDRVIAGEALDEVVDALTTEHQAAQLAAAES